MSYLGIIGSASAEQTIEKSRFIGYCSHVESEEEAKEFLALVREEHPTATHICYGYVADSLGNLQRFSDAGEPQGTAGLPILGVIKAQKLYETAVAVVRYFGGIKLGAGGLTRAYAGTTSLVLEGAQKRDFDTCLELRITIRYSDVNACLRFLAESSAELIKREFGEGAEFTVAVRERENKNFCEALVSALCGRVKTEEIRRYVYPFTIS